MITVTLFFHFILSLLLSVQCGFLSDLTDKIYYNVISLSERCDSKWVPINITGLEADIKKLVFGQPFVEKNIVLALKYHWNNPHPKKPLALSFHGSPGTGKNYVADIIAKNLFKEGTKSSFRKYFSRITFPLDSQVEQYKMDLQNTIKKQVSLCDRAMFIFDEVDKIPEGIFEVVKPFIDYHHHLDNIDFRKSIFIFLSNTGSTIITEECESLHRAGKKREEYKLKEFEKNLMKYSYNEEGGMRRSNIVKNHLIDIYIPFLPLEKEHVEECIKEICYKLGVDPNRSLIDSVIEELVFGPETTQLFATTGCKTLQQKVYHLLTYTQWEDRVKGSHKEL